mgnify:CR=1 FL=1
MKSIFSELPHGLIIDIIKIDNYRKKYDKVVEQINMVTTYDMFCPSIREMMNDADDADPAWDVMSVSQIWGWDDMRVMNDLSWLNELWKIIQRLRNEVIVEELDKLQKANGWDWRKRLSVYKQLYANLGWEQPEVDYWGVPRKLKPL